SSATSCTCDLSVRLNRNPAFTDGYTRRNKPESRSTWVILDMDSAPQTPPCDMLADLVANSSWSYYAAGRSRRIATVGHQLITPRAPSALSRAARASLISRSAYERVTSSRSLSLPS